MTKRQKDLEARLQQAGLRRGEAKQERSFAHSELAETVRAAHQANMPKVEIARLAGVSRQTIHNILKGAK